MAKQQETPSVVDLEETAELPVLPGAHVMTAGEDVLSGTDAYHAPSVARGGDPDATEYLDVAAARDPRVALGLREAEIGALRSDLASVTESRGQLERNLGNLTHNLRDLEQMLNRKSEQLSMFEREVGNRDRKIAEFESRVAELESQSKSRMAELQAQAQARMAELESQSKSRVADLQSQFGSRISELESRIATLDGERAAATSERDSLRTELKSARDDTEAAQKLVQAKDVTTGTILKEREQQARRIRVLEADLAQARAQAERYRESLQSMEGRRQIFEAMLDEREVEVIERGGTVARLEAEMTQRTELSVGRESDLRSLLSTEQARVRQLEQAAIIHRAEQEALRESAAEASRQADQRLAVVRAEMEAQQKESADLRARLDKVNSSLNERNSLIGRLEAEMASSSQVLGSIQHNLEHLGDAEPARMLVRTQGETGIVQLLGRRATVGRTPDNDIHLNEEFISRHHAVLLLAGASTVLEDLNSTNGTYVNGERINRRTLKEGDLVTLGKTEFRFVVKRA